MGPTPSQTVGPYLAVGMRWDGSQFADEDGMRISGLVLDGAGVPIADALVETWQPRPRAFARCATDDEGRWEVVVPPPEPVGGQAAHLAVSVFARGLLQRLVTRVYLPDNDAANATDPVLARVPINRRGTLVAERVADGYRFEIRIQGAGETVFFDV